MDLRSKLTLDGSDFSKTMNEAAGQVNDFSKKTEDANKAVGDMGKASKRTASELLQQMKSMEGLGRSSSNYRQQLAQISRQIQDLTINYRSMSAEMKNSDFGREVAAKLQELKGKAAEYKDAIMDAQNSVRMLASDTVNLDAAKMGIEGLSSAMQLFASVGILGEKNTEKVVKALAKLKAIESATNAVIKIANVLNKDSILMLKIKDLQTKAATKAQIQYTSATAGATVAQKAFNTVAKANPYVLLATAILAVIGALAAFSKSTNEAEEAQDDLNDSVNKAKEIQEKYKSTFVETYSSLLNTFKKLQIGYSSLRTEMEKTEFIKNNADEFKKLGIEATNVNNVEEALVKNSESFIRSLTLRAQAAANAAVAMEHYKQAAELEAGLNGFTDRLPRAGDLVPENVQNPRRYGLEFNQNGQHGFRFTEQGADQYILENKLATKYIEYKKSIDKANQSIEKQLELEREVAAINEQFNRGGGTTTTTTSSTGANNAPEYEEGSLNDLKAQLAELKKEYENTNLTIEQGAENLEKQRALEEEILRIEKLRHGMNPVETLPTLTPISAAKGLEKLQQYYDEHPLEAEIEVKHFTMSEMFGKLNDNIGQLGQINSAVQSIGNSVKTLNEGWDYTKSDLENITTQIGATINVIQSIVSIMQTISSIIEAINMLKGVGLSLETTQGKIIWANILAEKALVKEKSKEAAASGLAAAGEAANSAAKIPMVGWIIAIGAIAAIVGALVAAKGSMQFARGGIVPGTSFGGDNITAQVNSGEMILNTGQQRRLFDILDGKGSMGNGNGEVTFKIKGQELVGVLNNYDRKMQRI